MSIFIKRNRSDTDSNYGKALQLVSMDCELSLIYFMDTPYGHGKENIENYIRCKSNSDHDVCLQVLKIFYG